MHITLGLAGRTASSATPDGLGRAAGGNRRRGVGGEYDSPLLRGLVQVTERRIPVPKLLKVCLGGIVPNPPFMSAFPN